MNDQRAKADTGLAAFRALYAPPDEQLAARFLQAPAPDAAAEARIDAHARRLITFIRDRPAGIGGIEDFFREYTLTSREGLALMVLAEALLRVPDRATADRLIEDKLTVGDFLHYEAHSGAVLVSASAWALGLSARIVGAQETPHSVIDSLVSRLGRPAVRAAIRQAMQLLGAHFVLGETIDQALKRAANRPRFRYSFDMLREGARTAAEAERHYEAYAQAIAAIGREALEADARERFGISVKFSALHPRFEAISHRRVRDELVPLVAALAQEAKAHNLAFTVDAEEADRLELSLDIIADVLMDPALADWDGFGVAVQSYQKRAPEVVDWLIGAARKLGRKLAVRLVKGA